jgi:hypothetical protein
MHRFLTALLFGTTNIAVDSIFIIERMLGDFSPRYMLSKYQV